MKDYKKRYLSLKDPMNDRSLKVSYICRENARKDPPLLFIHGLFASIFSWRNNLDALSRDHTVYALDLKGHGDSDKPKGRGYSPMALTLLVKEFMNHLNIQRASLIGNSLGGGISLLMALHFPSLVSQLVLIAPACYNQRLPQLVRILKNPILRIPLYFFPAESIILGALSRIYYDRGLMTDEVIRGYSYPLKLKGTLSAYIQATKELIPEDISDIEKKIPSIRHKTLIIWGEEDRIIPVSFAKRLHEEMAYSSLTLIPKCGHVPHEEEPETVNRLMDDFLKEDS